MGQIGTAQMDMQTASAWAQPHDVWLTVTHRAADYPAIHRAYSIR
jgi:hypothetical protein